MLYSFITCTFQSGQQLLGCSILIAGPQYLGCRNFRFCFDPGQGSFRGAKCPVVAIAFVSSIHLPHNQAFKCVWPVNSDHNRESESEHGDTVFTHTAIHPAEVVECVGNSGCDRTDIRNNCCKINCCCCFARSGVGV